MTCPQLLRHSLACTAWQRPLGRRRRLMVRTRKGKRVPWRAERVQQRVRQSLRAGRNDLIPNRSQPKDRRQKLPPTILYTGPRGQEHCNPRTPLVNQNKPPYCCTRSARHGTLFPFLVFTPYLRRRADGRCRAVQARLCRKSCGHVIGLGPYLLSMTSYPLPLWL